MLCSIMGAVSEVLRVAPLLASWLFFVREGKKQGGVRLAGLLAVWRHRAAHSCM